jgi:hypothetical protein
MTIKSAVVESFAEYSQFGSLKEFNNHFEMWMVDKKCFFSKGELIGLKRLLVSLRRFQGWRMLRSERSLRLL